VRRRERRKMREDAGRCEGGKREKDRKRTFETSVSDDNVPSRHRIVHLPLALTLESTSVRLLALPRLLHHLFLLDLSRRLSFRSRITPSRCRLRVLKLLPLVLVLRLLQLLALVRVVVGKFVLASKEARNRRDLQGEGSVCYRDALEG
jgi:hypothetical protein